MRTFRAVNPAARAGSSWRRRVREPRFRRVVARHRWPARRSASATRAARCDGARGSHRVRLGLARLARSSAGAGRRPSGRRDWTAGRFLSCWRCGFESGGSRGWWAGPLSSRFTSLSRPRVPPPTPRRPRGRSYAAASGRAPPARPRAPPSRRRLRATPRPREPPRRSPRTTPLGASTRTARCPARPSRRTSARRCVSTTSRRSPTRPGGTRPRSRREAGTRTTERRMRSGRRRRTRRR